MEAKFPYPLLLWFFFFSLSSVFLSSFGHQIPRERTEVDRCIDDCCQEEKDVSGLFDRAAHCDKKYAAPLNVNGRPALYRKSGRVENVVNRRKAGGGDSSSVTNGRRRQQQCHQRCVECKEREKIELEKAQREKEKRERHGCKEREQGEEEDEKEKERKRKHEGEGRLRDRAWIRRQSQPRRKIRALCKKQPARRCKRQYEGTKGNLQ